MFNNYDPLALVHKSSECPEQPSRGDILSGAVSPGDSVGATCYPHMSREVSVIPKEGFS